MGNNNQKNNNNGAAQAAPTSEVKKEVVKLSADKQNVSVSVDGIVELHINSDAERISANANKDGKCEVSVNKNVVSVKGIIVGSTDITILGESQGKTSSNIVIPVNVVEKIKSNTKIVPNHSSLTLKKGETKEIKLDTDAVHIDAKVENDDKNIKVGIDSNRKVIFVTGNEVTLGNIIISGKAPNANESYIKISVAVEGADSISTQSSINAGSSNLPTQAAVSAEYLNKFSSYENTANLSLSRMIRVETFDTKSYGRIVKNYIFKELVRDMIRRTIGQVKLINTEYAKSAIRLIVDLKKEEYGQDVSDIQKAMMIRKIVDGNNLQI